MAAAKIILLITGLCWSGRDWSAPADSVRAFFFYSETCDHCQDVLTKVVPDLKRKYPVTFKFFEINDPENYRFLLEVEKYYQDHDNQNYPIIFFDKYSFSGVREIAAGLEEKIAIVVGEGGCEFPDPAGGKPPGEAPPENAHSPAAAKHPVYLAYFYEVGCMECSRARTDINVLQQEYPGLVVREYDVGKEKGLNETLCEKYGVPEQYRLSGPMVFMGDTYLREEDVNYDEIRKLIEEFQSKAMPPPWEVTVDQKDVKKTMLERFESIGVFAIAVAGLLDGLNPCAFATIVFFISYLTLVGRKGREIICVGSAFTLAIFITYLLVGLGFFHFIKSLSFIPLITRIVYSITIGLALLFGILSFYDFFKYRKGEYEDSFLKLPDFLRKRLNQVIRERARVRNFVAAAFVSGFLVSLLEFACTGQVYLPTVIFVTSIPGYKFKGILLLIMYNLAFILPLVVIFILAYKGVTSQRLSGHWKKYAPALKIGMGIFFISLAILLIIFMK